MPSMRGCYCVDAMMKMAADDSEKKLEAYKKCAASVGLDNRVGAKSAGDMKKELDRQQKEIM
jgi:hypothetical protein